MDSSEEDSIIPILYQIEQFGMRKNEQCISLESALNVATAKNEELKKEMHIWEKLCTTERDQIKQLDEECVRLKSSLSESNYHRENLDKVLIAARAKNEEFQKEIQTLRELRTAAEVEVENRNNECVNLKSLLSTFDFKLKNCERSYNTMNSQLKEVKKKNRNLELTLELSADACASKCKELRDENKKLKAKTENLESSLKTNEDKCASLVSSLMEAKNTILVLKIKCNDLDSSLLTMKAEKAELIMKCEKLEKSLHAANAKIEELELQLSESKKENSKYDNSKRKKVVMATLKKVENKLTKNPLFPMIDRMQQNIEKLDKMTKNFTPYSEQIKEIEIFDVRSSDDDRSTFSYVGDRRNDELELSDRSANQSQVDVFQNITNVSSPATNFRNLERATRNDRLNIQIENIDDSSCDSDISLNVFTSVCNSSIEEEHSFSLEKASCFKKSIPESLDSNSSTVQSDSSTSLSKKKKTEERVSEDDSFKLSEEKSEPGCINVPQIDLHPTLKNSFEIPDSNSEFYSNQTYESESNRLGEIIERLEKKTNQNIKLLRPVILLERCKNNNIQLLRQNKHSHHRIDILDYSSSSS